jgi:hypothetical protein
MRVNLVISNNQDAWQDVSNYWKDEKAEYFYSSGILAMESILNNLDSACEKLEKDTEDLLARLSKVENI